MNKNSEVKSAREGKSVRRKCKMKIILKILRSDNSENTYL
jgi:hypothetical protein